MTNNYIPLHVHSDASADGAGTVQALVQRAKEMEFSALALTDHGTLGNAVAFWGACQDAEIKPIFGLEAYFQHKAKRHHLTLLSLNEQGFNNLIGLNNLAHAEHYTAGYPLVTIDSLEQHREGLFVLSGCAASALYQGEESDALLYAGELLDVMGRDHLAMEVMFAGTLDTHTRPLAIGAKLGLPWVVTNDTHFPCQHQFPAHQAITKARHGFTYDSQELWLKSRAEIVRSGQHHVAEPLIQAGLDRSLYIADMVAPVNLKAPPNLPSIPHAKQELKEYLTRQCKRDVIAKGQKDIRYTRLKYEWNILRIRGFLDYIFILWDIVAWAKITQGIRVGPARGSGGGSYVLYLLGITSIDPLEHNLIFERFINPARVDYPDVDVDFESDRRQEVINYANERWGAIPIATYSSYSHKSAVHDIARVLGIPQDLEVPAAEHGVDSQQFIDFINHKPDAKATYDTMVGQIRHRGKHAAGVIIPNRPVPIERTGTDGDLVAAWAEGMNTKDLSKVGIVKFDLLGLTSLNQIAKMEELTGVDVQSVSLDDPEVYNLFCTGDVAGIFQWTGSDGIRELTQKIAPRNFYDLTTCNALYRPGALDAGTAEEYPHYMKNPRKLHPRIDKHLTATYGVICYQEQVMNLVAEMMGEDLAQADLARRLISKAPAKGVIDLKWEKDIEALHQNFVAKAEKQGFDSTLIDQMWHEIYTHSGYSYNLSHASAYTLISYWMAWFKVYHRAEYTVSVLQYDKANAQTYILDAIAHGLEVKMPNVNYSTKEYVLRNDTIYLPLTDVNFLGEKGIDAILEWRESNGEFTSYKDFADNIPKRAVNNRAKGMLERIGAFSDLTGDPKDAIDKYDELELKDNYQTQLEILGYVIPTQKLYQKIEEMRQKKARKGWTRFAGFISAVKRKRSAYGEYTVFTLSPSGSFWMREPSEKMVVGKFVSGTKNVFGKSNDAKTYKLT